MAKLVGRQTTVSTKGQVILPKAIRDAKNWGPGVRLSVEDTPQGVLLKSAAQFVPTLVEDVAGMLKYFGPSLSVDDMDAAVDAEFRRRHGHD